MKSIILYIAFPLIVSFTACQERPDDDVIVGDPERKVQVSTLEREVRAGAGVLSQYDLESENPETVDLPKRLDEISGLASTDDGSIFGHNDEKGVINKISIESGDIDFWFTVGSITLSEDLEGIAYVDGYFWLVNSKGDLFRFRHGESEGSVDFDLATTDLSGKYDVEGLCYDPTTNALLLACKEYPGEGLDKKDEKAIYSFSLDSLQIDPTPRFVLDAKGLEKRLDLKKFMPSAIEWHPETGNFVILSGNDPAIIEISPSGEIITALALSKKIHPQPEGVTFAPDGSLLIGNEGGGLVRYRRR